MHFTLSEKHYQQINISRNFILFFWVSPCDYTQMQTMMCSQFAWFRNNKGVIESTDKRKIESRRSLIAHEQAQQADP